MDTFSLSNIFNGLDSERIKSDGRSHTFPIPMIGVIKLPDFSKCCSNPALETYSLDTSPEARGTHEMLVDNRG